MAKKMVFMLKSDQTMEKIILTAYFSKVKISKIKKIKKWRRLFPVSLILFQVFRDWSGILIEPNQESFVKIQLLNRKSLLLNTCVSPSNYSEQFTFVINPFDGHGTNFLGGISDHLELRRVFEMMNPHNSAYKLTSITSKPHISKNAVLRGMYETHFAGGDLYKEIFILISHWSRPNFIGLLLEDHLSRESRDLFDENCIKAYCKNSSMFPIG